MNSNNNGSVNTQNSKIQMKAVTVSNSPMIQLDVNMKVLKEHLDMISKALNQHSEVLNGIQTDLGQKVTQKSIIDLLQFLGENSKFSNQNMTAQILQEIANNKKIEATGNEYDNKRNKFTNQLISFGHAITNNHSNIAILSKQVKDLQMQVQGKAEQDYVKKRFKKIKLRNKQNLEDQKHLIFDYTNQIDKKQTQEILSWEEKLLNLEKKTIWKINEQEEQIKRRITEDYVNDSIRALEERLKKEFGGLFGSESLSIDSIVKEINLKIDQVENNLNQKIKENRKGIAENTDKINKDLLYRVTFEEFKVTNKAEIKNLQDRVKILENLDIKNNFERLNNRFKDLENINIDIRTDMDLRYQRLSKQLESGGNGGGSGGEMSLQDQHELCRLRADLERNIKNTDSTANDLIRVEENNKLKIEGFEQIIKMLQGQLYEFNRQINQNQNQTQIDQALYNRTEKLEMQFQILQEKILSNSSNNDKFLVIENNINALQKKFDQIKDIDKRVARMIKELDLANLSKILKGKSDQEDVLKDFAIMDSKINNNTEGVSYLRKDVDNLIFLYKKMVQNMSNGVQDSPLIITQAKGLTNKNCLSCGGPKTSKYNRLDNSLVIGSKSNIFKDQYNTYEHQPINTQQDGNYMLNKNDSQASLNYQLNSNLAVKKVQRPGTATIRDDKNVANSKSSQNLMLRPTSAKK